MFGMIFKQNYDISIFTVRPRWIESFYNVSDNAYSNKIRFLREINFVHYNAEPKTKRKVKTLPKKK